MEDLQDKIIELMDLFDDEVVTTADKIDRPQQALDREAYKDFMDRNPMAGGGMLVQPSADGSRPGYAKDKKKAGKGSLYKSGDNGWYVSFGDRNKGNFIGQYFGAKQYGSVAKAKKAAENFRAETAKDYVTLQTKPGIKQPAAEKAIQELLDEGAEITTKNILDKMPKKMVKEGVSDSVLDKAKKKFPNLDFKPVDRTDVFIKAPKDIARVKKLIEDGLPMKEIQAEGYDPKFIRRVARVNELKIAETSYDYYKNVKKITNDLTKLGKNKKIIDAFENGTVSNKLLEQVGKVTKSKDPFYDSRLLFKLAEYYEGSLEEWYKPKLDAPTENQKLSADKVIRSSATFQGGKRNGYAYQSDLYKWGAKQIDQVLDLPLGTFKSIQEDIAKVLPSGISLDEVFGVKSSGRYSPIEGILTNPLESGANVDKGSFVDNVKSNYQKQLVDASGNPKKQKEILKDYNDVVQKSKVRYPDVEFPNYKVGQPPNKTIKGFNKLPPLIQKKLLENYERTGISPITKKATSIFDIAKATGSKTFGKLDESVQASLSNITSKQEKIILNNLQINSKLKECKIPAADGGRIGFANSIKCIEDGLNETRKAAAAGDKKAARQLVETAEAASKGGRLLKNLLGPGALLGEAVFEGAIIGNKLLEGKPLKQAWAESYLSYLDPRKYSGELDPTLLQREQMLESTADKNILQSGFDAQDRISAFNKARRDEELAEIRQRPDQLMTEAEREKLRAYEKQSSPFIKDSQLQKDADIISSEAFKDASNIAQEYIQGQEGQRMFPFNKFKQSIGGFESGEAKDFRRRKEEEMKNLYKQYSDDEVRSFLKQSLGTNDDALIDKYLELTGVTKRITPAVTTTLSGLDVLRTGDQIQQSLGRIADAGGVANLARGGRAGFKVGKLAKLKKSKVREDVKNIIDDSIKKQEEREFSPNLDLDALIKKTLNEDFLDKKDTIIDTLNAKIARERKNFPYNQQVFEEPSQLEFYNDIIKSNFKTKTGPFFDYQKRKNKAGGGLLKQAGDRSGPPPESGPNSQGLQGLLNRVKKV
jgi:hypothetical protein